MKQLYILLLYLVMIGCETVVDVPIPNDPPSLVLNSTLTPEDFIRVNISQSQSILDNSDFTLVTGAKVDIYEDDVLLETLPDSTNGNYVSAINKPKRGKTYKVIASKSGFNEASADVAVPLDTANIIGVTIDTVEISNYGYSNKYLQFNIEIKDNANRKDFYELSLVNEFYAYEYDFNVDPPVLVDSVFRMESVWLESRDPGLEDFQLLGQSILFSDELFNGKSYTMSVLVYYDNFNYEGGPYLPYSSDPKFSVVLNKTSESYYLYNITTSLQRSTSGNPFAQPVQVYTNVKNGFGILGAYNTSTFPINN